MKAQWQNRLTLAVAAVALVAALVLTIQTQSARAERSDSPAAPAHYTVVMTEGHNLLVTDNGANKLYFYTIDKDKPIGSPLKLRASINLTDVGREEIKITPHNLEK
jgi:hypothetical protein